MEIKQEDVSYKLLCTACLCEGRKLHRITNEKSHKYYLDALIENSLFIKTSISLLVCWECKALLQKAISFREQIQNSYRILVSYNNETLNKSLLSISRKPRLEIHSTDPISIKPTNEYDDIPEMPECFLEISVKDEVKDVWDCDKVLDDSTSHLEDDCLVSDSPENGKQSEIDPIQELSSVKKDKKLNKNSKSKMKKVKKIIKSLKVKKKKTPSKSRNQKILTIELTYEEMLLDRENETKSDLYVKSEYKCESCVTGFNNEKCYLAHVAAKHSQDLGEYNCPICKTIFSSVDSFTAHYKRHTRRYECTVCKKRTMDYVAMQKHYFSAHETSLKEYKCELCGKISKTVDRHRYHKQSHKARVMCTECGKTFKYRTGLNNHRHYAHEIHEYPCTVCGKVFGWKTSLKRHLEKHDVQGKSSTAAAYCSMCDVSFATQCSYKRHLKSTLKHVTPDQLKYICDHCNKRFADKTKLRDHIEEKHLHKTFHCHICLKPSKNRMGLDQHIRNVHKRRPNNKICQHCGKGFPTKVQLESHIRSHTGERPFICEFCPTTFTQSSNLNKHKRQVHLHIKYKRNSICKRKEDNPPVDTMPDDAPAVDPYTPVVLEYGTETAYVA